MDINERIDKYLDEGAPKISPSETKALLKRYDNDMLYGKHNDGKWYVIQPIDGKANIDIWKSPDNDYPPGKDWSEVKIKIKGFKKIWSWDLYV